MHLLLLSLGASAVPTFLRALDPRPAEELRIGYIADAAGPYAGYPFVQAERDRIAAFGFQLVDLTIGELSRAQAAAALDGVDAVYVAGGNTFALLAALRSEGADLLITERVRAGMPYIGSSAGSIIVGPTIEPSALMDDPAAAPELSDYRGLGLIGSVVIPHADGQLPQYPGELIAEIVSLHGDDHRLVLLHDDQALFVSPDGQRIVASECGVSTGSTSGSSR